MKIKLITLHPTRHFCFLFSLMVLYCGYLIAHFSSLSYQHKFLSTHSMTWIHFQNQDTSEFISIIVLVEGIHFCISIKLKCLLIGQVIHRSQRYLSIWSFGNWTVQGNNEKQYQNGRCIQSYWNQHPKSVKWTKHSLFSFWRLCVRK